MQEINNFFSKLKMPGTVIQVGETDRVDRQIVFGEEFDFENYIEANQSKNLYFLAGVQEGTAGRAKDLDVVKKNYLCFDFDIRETEKRSGRDCDDAQLQTKAKEILDALDLNEQFKFYSYAVLSGNGLHVHYFGNPIDIASPEVFKAGMERLVEQISEVAGLPADKSCVNAARIFRIPGSVNQKNNKQAKILIEQEIVSPLLNDVQEIGELELEKQSKEIVTKPASALSNTEGSVYEAINAIRIQDIVCKVMSWRFDGKKHWYAPGSNRISACFLARDGNYVVHGGTNHFSDQQKGYSPFQFVKMIKKLSDRETFEWFENEYPAIKEIAEKERKKFSSKNRLRFAPDDIVCLAENKNKESQELKMNLDCIPPNTILSDFLALHEGVTDTPDEFLMTAGLVGIASTISEAWFPFGTQKLRPHLWAIILAPSSRFRKTTAINAIKSIITNVDQNLVFSDENTPEVFIEYLSRIPAGLFTFSEMGGFLKQTERSYMQGFKEVLANLYDSPELYTRTRKDKNGNPTTFEIRNPAINILSASTMDWLLKNAGESDIGSGFLPRFIFTHRFTKTKETILFPQQVDASGRQKIIDDLRLLNTEWKGEKVLSPEAERLYKNWAQGVEKQMGLLENPQVDTFWTRLNVTCIKFALIGEAMLQVKQFHQSDNEQFNNCAQISEEAMRFAINLADYYRHSSKELVCNEFRFGKFAQIAKKIKQILIKNGGQISKRDLLRVLGIRVDELDVILQTLESSGEIVNTDETKISGQKTQIIKLITDIMTFLGFL